jgi:choice-of-anchor C domain-containing protein
MTFVKTTAAVGLMCFTTSLASATTIPIANGSFENPVVGGNFNTYFGPNNTSSLPGWTINGSIDQIGNYWQAADGKQSLDMAGNFAGSIQQSVFIPGSGTATVNFSMAGNPDEPSLKFLTVTLIGDGGPQLFTFDSTGHTLANMGWINLSATFNIPSSGNYILEFSDTGNPADPWGPALDNVSMSANVPEGGMTFLLLGFSILAIVSFRQLAAASRSGLSGVA